MIMGLYDEELMETCIFLMVEESLQEIEIKDILDRQLVSCDNEEKEEQISRDCGHKGQEWYVDLKKHFLEWEKNKSHIRENYF